MYLLWITGVGLQIMEREFPEERDRMLDRVVTYMATLQNNSFIQMRGKGK